MYPSHRSIALESNFCLSQANSHLALEVVHPPSLVSSDRGRLTFSRLCRCHGNLYSSQTPFVCKLTHTRKVLRSIHHKCAIQYFFS